MPHPRSNAGWLAAVLLVIVLLPAIYLLSSGPAAVLVFSRRMSYPTYATLYAPLILLCDRNETADAISGWYDNI